MLRAMLTRDTISLPIKYSGDSTVESNLCLEAYKLSAVACFKGIMLVDLYIDISY